MEDYKKFEIKQDNDEYIYDYNFGANNLYNASIKEKYEKKFDILFDGILSNNRGNIKIDELN